MTDDTSSMFAEKEDSSYLFDLAHVLQTQIQGTMTQGASVVEVVSKHLRIAAHFDAKANLYGTTVVPAMTEEMTTYGANQTKITLPANGLSMCSSNEFVSFGIMEWGIMPVAYSNSSLIEDIEDSLVQLTIAIPDVTPTADDVNNRYIVDVFLQQAIDFNISYPYEGFNRTYPMLFTTDVNDGTNFIQQDCNATSFTDTTITFDCPDMGNMCTENTENSVGAQGKTSCTRAMKEATAQECV